MKSASELLQMCEGFFRLIENQSKNAELDAAIESVRDFLETEVHRWKTIEDVTVASIVRQRIDEVWKRIDPSEKIAKGVLTDSYVGIQRFAKSYYRKWYEDHAGKRQKQRNARKFSDGNFEEAPEDVPEEEECGDHCDCTDINGDRDTLRG